MSRGDRPSRTGPAPVAPVARGHESWRELTRGRSHPAFGQRPRESSLCFIVDLDSGGTRPRLNLASPEATLSLVLATRARDRSAGFERVTPLSVVPRAPFPPGPAGVVCELAASTLSPIVCLSRELCEELLAPLCREGLLYGLRDNDLDNPVRLTASREKAWCLRLEAESVDGDPEGPVAFSGRIQRSTRLGEETLAPTRIDSLFEVGFVVTGEELGKLDADCVAWVARLKQGRVLVPRAELPEFLGALAALPEGPRVTNLEELGFAACAERPEAVLRLGSSMDNQRLLRGTLVFRYKKPGSMDAWELGCEMRADTLVDAERRVLALRDYAEESRIVARLGDAGFEVRVWETGAASCPFDVRVHFDDLVRSSERLLDDGVRIEFDGSPCRPLRSFRLFIDSEQDWFELKGHARFDQHALELPELLEHVRKRRRLVQLSDGSSAIIPEKWFAELDPLASLVNPKHKQLRFHALQALLIDGILGSWSPAADPGFTQMKERVREFAGVQPRHEQAGFRGELRPYQRVALGWLAALEQFRLGGCLADDMGLGKTVVVLAWLWSRASNARGSHGKVHRPSLLVAPKSLLFNWRQEARAFTPELKLLVYHGSERQAALPRFGEYDLIITSYGTLRRDASELALQDFDYVVLDEAHNIKNEASLVHRSVRRLSSHARLALSGTPIENHLLELWSLLSFLNPAIFERLDHIRRTFERGRVSQVALKETVQKLVRPFILRRTKAEVAPELPARIEKTLYVPLTGAQAVVYRELADHYRARMLDQRQQRRYLGGAVRGVSHHNGHEAARALEALLRLRQAACHPALLGTTEGLLESPEARAAVAPDAPSAKLDLLLEKLAALSDEGHKALVFSQFTGFLGLVREALVRRKLRFEYLDGQTQQREAVVQRFQNAVGPCIFLISLKTGGSGLNLTAAEYVFLLDPWWNPAVEAQAVDRAHRIGQTRPVIAYRLLAKGTVEAKVAALQADKRALTDGLFADEAAFSEKLTREDFEYLLA
ncbi:MAG: DEAD/DEAH box helicase [Myxococcota bacterium]